jgi:hypothetical protein
VLLTRAGHQRVFYDERLAWADLLAGGSNVRLVPGDHENFLDELQVAGVAAALAATLERG